MDSAGNLQSYMFVYATLLARSFLILSDGRASFYSESTSCDKCVILVSFSLPPSRILITTRDECELNGRNESEKLERKRASFIHSFLSPQSGSSSARPAVGTRCRQRRGSEGNRFDPPSQVVEKYTERDWDRRLVINEIHWYG